MASRFPRAPVEHLKTAGGIQGSAADVSVAKAPVHLQGSSGPCLSGSEQFGQQKGDRDNMKQMVEAFCLNGGILLVHRGQSTLR